MALLVYENGPMVTIFSCLLQLLFLQWSHSEVLPPQESNFVDSEQPVFDIAYISRDEWSGKPPLSTEKLQHPVDLVIIAHTATSFCTTFSECSKLLQAMQNYHLQNKNPDIVYNFVIGGDGNIYIGRGWDVKNGHKKQPSISVSFIGNFLKDKLSDDMIAALEKLLADGVASKKLTDNFKMVAHNQTKATLSPGDNVYEVIRKLKHFQEGDFS